VKPRCFLGRRCAGVVWDFMGGLGVEKAAHARRSSRSIPD
jgi:hypothetical protein